MKKHEQKLCLQCSPDFDKLLKFVSNKPIDKLLQKSEKVEEPKAERPKAEYSNNRIYDLI